MTLGEHMQLCERLYLQTLAASYNRSVMRMAAAAGVNRTHMYKILARHGMQPASRPTSHRGNWASVGRGA
jgi:FAD/FMN-containing dehydrogenase